MPENHDYKIISAEVSHKEFEHITALIRVNINAEEADKWKSDFESSSKTDYRVKKTWGELGSDRRTLFKVTIVYYIIENCAVLQLIYVHILLILCVSEKVSVPPQHFA